MPKKPCQNMLVSRFRTDSAANESFKIVRTNLKYYGWTHQAKTLVLTSTDPGEGKSTIAANLAVSLSQTGKKVILIDADLRIPVQHHIFAVENRQGLADVLSGRINLFMAIHPTQLANLWLLTSGTVPHNPSELLGNGRLATMLDELKTLYDFILLDCPPVLPVTDTVLIAAIAEGTVLVAREGETDLKRLVAAKRQLAQGNARLLGVIMNKVRRNKKENRYYHYYSSRRG